MATVRMTGWGTGKYNKWYVVSPTEGILRGRGWGGGQQWKTYCDGTGSPVQGSAGGAQTKLECESV